MHEHWASFGPPVYISVASYLGLHKKTSGKKSPSKQKTTPAEWDNLMAMFPGGAI